MTLGQALKRDRRKKGPQWSTHNVARKTKLSAMTISNLERDRVKKPRVETLDRLATFYGGDIAEYLRLAGLERNDAAVRTALRLFGKGALFDQKFPVMLKLVKLLHSQEVRFRLRPDGTVIWSSPRRFFYGTPDFSSIFMFIFAAWMDLHHGPFAGLEDPGPILAQSKPGAVRRR